VVREPSRRRRLLFALLTAVLTWSLCELLVALALSGEQAPVATLEVDRVLGRHRRAIERLIAGETELTALSPSLGWTMKPGGAQGPLRVNSQGLRGDRDYAPTPAPGTLRLTTFGDSFTLGAEVALEDTWQARLEESIPGLEALNFGVGGFGPDQAYLRYLEEGRYFAAQVVVLGVMSENINRLINVYRPFYLPTTGLPLTKPRFRLAGGKLELVPNPLPSAAAYRELLAEPEIVLARLGEYDANYRQYRPTTVPLLTQLPSVRAVRFWQQRLLRRAPAGAGQSGARYQTDSEAYQVLLRLLDAFEEQVTADGARPLVVLFPTRQDVAALVAGGEACYAPLVEDLAARAAPYVDVAPAFVARAQSGQDVAELFAPEAHYSAAGNRLVAEVLAAHLRSHGLIPEALAPR